MWMIDIALLPTVCANNVYELTKKKDFVDYVYCIDFSLIPTTWIDAINAYLYTTWSDLTADLLCKYLTKSVATKGQMQQVPMGTRSTQ